MPDHPLDERVMRCGGNGRIAREHAEIVHAFEDDEISDGAALEHVAAEPGDGIGSDAGVDQAIAADAEVEHRKRARRSFSRSARKSVQRVSVFDTTPCPSVIKSPTIATAADGRSGSTSTPVRKYQ